MRFDIITIFPNIFEGYFGESIIKRAQEKKLIKINIHNLRDHTKDKHKNVDDNPYGGGAGMVLMAEPICNAVKSILKKTRFKKSEKKVLLLSPKGNVFNQKKARSFSKLKQIIIICGRYEGVDERIAKYIADEQISIGDYILTGGELPAMIILDAVTRLLSGVIKKESLIEESFSDFKIYHEYPHYTRPESIIINKKKREVPDVLLSGNHKEIKEWHEKHSRIKK